MAKKGRVTEKTKTIQDARQVRGCFITLEGCDGAGKTTHVDWLAAELQSRGIPLVKTREPGGTLLGESIRDWVLSNELGMLSHTAELLLMFAARAQHVEELIWPRLRAGEWVLCERFVDSSYAYQGGGRGLPVEEIADLERMMKPALKPDLTILLDLPPERAIKRKFDNSNYHQIDLFEDRLEREVMTFHEKVREAYRDLACAEKDRIKLINTKALSVQGVRCKIKKAVDDFLTGKDFAK